jgi:hypothetical protein
MWIRGAQSLGNNPVVSIFLLFIPFLSDLRPFNRYLTTPTSQTAQRLTKSLIARIASASDGVDVLGMAQDGYGAAAVCVKDCWWCSQQYYIVPSLPDGILMEYTDEDAAARTEHYARSIDADREYLNIKYVLWPSLHDPLNQSYFYLITHECNLLTRL